MNPAKEEHFCKDDIGSWFDEGMKQHASHMVIVYDEDVDEDAPWYVETTSFNNAMDSARNMVRGIEEHPALRVVEVYNLHMDREEQLAEHRAFHY